MSSRPNSGAFYVDVAHMNGSSRSGPGRHGVHQTPPASPYPSYPPRYQLDRSATPSRYVDSRPRSFRPRSLSLDQHSRPAFQPPGHSRQEPYTENDARRKLSKYIVVEIVRAADSYDGSGPTWEKTTHSLQSDASQREARRTVHDLNANSLPVETKMRQLPTALQRQLDVARDRLQEEETDPRYAYYIAQLELKSRSIERSSERYGRRTREKVMELVSITAFYKRTPGPHESCLRMLEGKELKEAQAIRRPPSAQSRRYAEEPSRQPRLRHKASFESLVSSENSHKSDRSQPPDDDKDITPESSTGSGIQNYGRSKDRSQTRYYRDRSETLVVESTSRSRRNSGYGTSGSFSRATRPPPLSPYSLHRSNTVGASPRSSDREVRSARPRDREQRRSRTHGLSPRIIQQSADSQHRQSLDAQEDIDKMKRLEERLERLGVAGDATSPEKSPRDERNALAKPRGDSHSDEEVWQPQSSNNGRSPQDAREYMRKRRMEREQEIEADPKSPVYTTERRRRLSDYLGIFKK